MSTPRSAAEFTVPDRADWLAAVEKVLRGRSFEDVLVGHTRDGLDIQPLYTEAVDTPGAVPAPQARITSGWDVRQRHRVGVDPRRCAREIIEELERGVTSVELAVAPATDAATMAAALDGIHLDLAPVALAPHADPGLARTLAGLLTERGDASSACWLGLDPIGELARGGEADAAAVLAAAAGLTAACPRGRTVTVDATRYADAAATEAQELGWAMATGVAYLRHLEAAGTGPGAAAATIGFRLSAGADQFLTIAKLRAARLLWGRVLEACGVAPDGRIMALHAVTSRAMYSRRDPWVNLLRGTAAALAAAVGGADAVTVLPFDDAIGETDTLARRLARNTQLLLLEESHLAAVVDPAAGSWYVESLTRRLAEAAWAELRRVEGAGGIETALRSGDLAARLDDAWQRRLADLATRREGLTGVSEFPDLDEAPVERPARPDAGSEGLPLRRLAAPFEALRDRSDRVLADTGRRPFVHLATLGPLAVHTARSTWIANLAAVGGIAVRGGDGDGALSPIEAEARFTGSGATVAVVCSSDGVYAERAAATATALKEAGAARVVLAGAPDDLREELDAAGVDEYWFAGMDVLDALTRLHDLLGT